MTEIEKVKAEIKMLEKKLSFLEELEKTKSPVEEAYKNTYGFYPDGRGNGVWTIADDWGWQGFQAGYKSASQDYKVGEYQEPKENEWKNVALRFGEKLVSISPCGYYEYTPEGWYEWVVNTYEKLADDWLSLLKKEKIKKEKVEKSKINDLAEKLLPDDHPYKITDEHGETNPYKQGLNMIKKDKETEELMEKLGFVKNSDGNWTAQPLVETAEEQTKDKVPLYKRFENEGAYGQLYYDDALKVVRGFLIDEGVIGYEDEEYITITLQKSLLDVFND